MINGTAQNNTNIIWVKPLKDNLRVNNIINIEDKNLQNTFNNYEVKSFKQALPFAKNSKLQNIYQI